MSADRGISTGRARRVRRMPISGGPGASPRQVPARMEDILSMPPGQIQPLAAYGPPARVTVMIDGKHARSIRRVRGKDETFQSTTTAGGITVSDNVGPGESLSAAGKRVVDEAVALLGELNARRPKPAADPAAPPGRQISAPGRRQP